jgi:hypothetical protein
MIISRTPVQMLTSSLELVNLLVNFLVVSTIAKCWRGQKFIKMLNIEVFFTQIEAWVLLLCIYLKRKNICMSLDRDTLPKKKHVILRFTHNMKHKCEGSIMKIFFDILQNMFQELMWKFELDITFLLDVFTCLLYNRLCN